MGEMDVFLAAATTPPPLWTSPAPGLLLPLRPPSLLLANSLLPSSSLSPTAPDPATCRMGAAGSVLEVEASHRIHPLTSPYWITSRVHRGRAVWLEGDDGGSGGLKEMSSKGIDDGAAKSTRMLSPIC